MISFFAAKQQRGRGEWHPGKWWGFNMPKKKSPQGLPSLGWSPLTAKVALIWVAGAVGFVCC